jgi:hypothetical protein
MKKSKNLEWQTAPRNKDGSIRGWAPKHIKPGKPLTDRVIRDIEAKRKSITPYVIEIPSGVGYGGCGSGYVTIRKTDSRVIAMSYTDVETGEELNEQNILMSNDGGKILFNEGNEVKITADFSCHEACLF